MASRRAGPPARPGAYAMQVLERSILAGKVAPGRMLPPEAELARELGVGRRSVREALKALEAKGLVETRMGVGTFVRRDDLDAFLDGLARNVRSYVETRRALAEHVAGLRELVEGPAVRSLAERPRAETLRRLAEAIAAQRRACSARDVESYQKAHLAFHAEIVSALGNPLASMVHGRLFELMRRPMSASAAGAGVMKRAIAEHERIMRAIENGRTDAATRSLRRHLAGFVAVVGGGRTPRGAGEPG